MLYAFALPLPVDMARIGSRADRTCVGGVVAIGTVVHA